MPLTDPSGAEARITARKMNYRAHGRAAEPGPPYSSGGLNPPLTPGSNDQNLWMVLGLVT